jgi:6,7-dimethyl-8-ribityllumazine synthase
MPTYEGRLDATGLRVAVVAGRFNEAITRQLLDGALSGFRRHGVDEAGVTVDRKSVV